jgi:DNA-binding transcriptional LysR family regulator
MFDWNDLKFLLGVARAGSTLAASRSMNISQSTVHRRLLELEKRLGQRLVSRHSNGYRLTVLGEAVVPLAESIERSATAVERLAAGSAPGFSGTVRLTCPEALVNRLVASRLLEMFRARFPEITVELVMSDRFLNLTEGEADIAIRAGELAGDDLIARKLATSEWAVYASRSYVERFGKPRDVADIDTHTVIDFDGPLSSHRAGQWLRAVAPNARSVARNNSIAGLLQAVRAGLGITPLPMALGAEHELVQLFEPVPELTTYWYLLVHRDLRHTPRFAAFYDFVIEEIALIRPLLMNPAASPSSAAVLPVEGEAKAC